MLLYLYILAVASSVRINVNGYECLRGVSVSTSCSGSGLYINLLKKALTAEIYDESGWEIKGPREDKWHIKNRPLRYFMRKSLLVIKVKPFDEAARKNGMDWPLFGYTMVGHRRLDNIQLCVESVLKEDIPGDFVETGAWRGGSTILMRGLLKVNEVTNRNVWVADSFEGLPVPKDENDGADLSQLDYLSVSLEQVQLNFKKFDLLDEQVKFLKGWFFDTLPGAPINKIAVLRLDGDLYSSTMDALENLYHKVSKGGYVIVDDYYSWESCRRAVNEFLEKNSLKADIIDIDGSGAYWKVK